ncbi:G-protein coupled receptor 126 isoform X3 [Arapaima gigas]
MEASLSSPRLGNSAYLSIYNVRNIYQSRKSCSRLDVSTAARSQRSEHQRETTRQMRLERRGSFQMCAALLQVGPQHGNTLQPARATTAPSEGPSIPNRLRAAQRAIELLCNKREICRMFHISGSRWRWKFQNILSLVLLLVHIHYSAQDCQLDCIRVLTAPEGSFWSPCYPSNYPKNQACCWTLKAPPGFIVQIVFLDFELEEALGCIYDRVVVSTGTNSVPFCGITANGLTLNSSGNIMDVSFNSDFSVQKRGFNISYRQGIITDIPSDVHAPELGQIGMQSVTQEVRQPPISTLTSNHAGAKSSSWMQTHPSGWTPGATCEDTGFACTSGMHRETSEMAFQRHQTTMAPTPTLWSTLTTSVSFVWSGDKEIASGQVIAEASTDIPSLGHSNTEGSGGSLPPHNQYWSASTVGDMSSVSLSPVSVGATGAVRNPQQAPLLSNKIQSPTVRFSFELFTTGLSKTEPVSPAYFSETASTSIHASLEASHLPHIADAAQEVFYRITFVVRNKNRLMTEQNVNSNVTSWFNQTFENWTYDVFFVVSPARSSVSPALLPLSFRYTFQALLKIKYTSGIGSTTLQDSINEWLVSRNQTLGVELVLESVLVQPLENCIQEENPFHYYWPETPPAVNQSLPCFPNKAQSAYRTCDVNWQNFTSFWTSADVSNCTDINAIEVSAENAAEVATTLADLTHSKLSIDEVSKVMMKLKEIVNVARINVSLASTMVTVFSNVMTSSDTVLAGSSERALKTVEELVQKIEFDGPSLSIISQNLAVGISSFNSSSFTGTSFSTYISNGTDLKIDFDSERQQDRPLAAVTLPATLLSNLSQAEAEPISRINFMFFSKTSLFQDQKKNSQSLNSYVVASSVGNLSISNLQDPVRIEITHLQHQHVSNPACVFWDFTINNGSGGWNSTGCTVSEGSDSNRTVCLCNHLTNFGILMDISGTAALIDEKNNKILTFITYVGCGVSAICSALTLLTYITFEKLRRDYPSKILMNLSTSLLFLNMVFLLDSWLASFDNTGLCISVAFFLHYFLLTSFTWMGLESIHMYIALVKVFNTYIRRYILKFCIVGWGLPAAIVAIVVAVDRNSYGMEFYGKDEHGQGSSQFCWLKSRVVFYVTCVGYFSVIFLMNVAMFIVVMIQICGRNGKRSNRTLREEMLRSLRSAASLTFLLGMTWGFAFFAWGPVNLAFMYLFSIFNSMQGLFIFIFHCALKENVQKQWQRYLCCGRFRLADNSDWSKTATNNTKKVSSDNLAKSLSSCSFGSSTANWTSKAKATLNPFTKRCRTPVFQVIYSRLHRQSWDLNNQPAGSKSGSISYLTL